MGVMSNQKERAEKLRAMHLSGPPLVFMNVWDVAGARIVENLGAPALATSSAAIANALGYPDGQKIAREEMLDVVRRICAAVKVPVTADMEAGYGSTAAAMADTAKALVASGAVGLNLEDTEDDRFIPLDVAVAKIRAIRAAGQTAGVPLVINARTDVYLQPGCKESGDYAEAVRRTRAFREAGADCVFLPGLLDIAVIKQLLRDSPGPINILALPKGPSLREFLDAGVRRISVGSGTFRAVMAMLQRIAAEAMQKQDLAGMFQEQIAYKDLNTLLG